MHYKIPIANQNIPNIGGIAKVELFLSSDVLQQGIISQNFIPQLILRYAYMPIAIWEFKDSLTGENSFSLIQTGLSIPTFNFKLELDAPLAEVETWYNKIRNTMLCVVITNLNGNVQVYNPYYISLTYLGASGHTQKNSYAITFSRSRELVNYPYISVLSPVSIKHYEFPEGNGYYTVTVNAREECDLSLYRIFVSDSDDLATAKERTTQITITKEGTYYLWAVHKQYALYVSKQEFTISITQISTNETTNYIIADGETTPDNDVQIGD